MIIYGVNATLQAIENDLIIKLYATEEVKAKHLKNTNTKVELKTKHELAKIAKTDVHQGIVAEIKTPFIKDLDYLKSQIQKGNVNNILYLDHIEDQNNLGAIIRSAEIFGFDTILIAKDRAANVTSTTIKTSAGAIFNTSIIPLNNVVNVIKFLKENNFWVVGGVLAPDSIELNKINFDFKTCLVVGNEGNGISNTIIKQLDYKAIIPMQGQTQSLNASVSAAIMMYQASLANVQQ